MRNLSDDDLEKKLKEFKLELLKEMGNKEMGGNVKNPGKIKLLRRDIARVQTIKREKEKKK